MSCHQVVGLEVRKAGGYPLYASHKFFSARILAGDENTVSTPIYYLRSACHRVVQGVVPGERWEKTQLEVLSDNFSCSHYFLCDSSSFGVDNINTH